MNTQMTIAEVMEEFTKNNKINNYGLWYDWFCNLSSLQKRGEKMLKKLSMIVNSTKFDKNKTYVWFKNNCPLYGDYRLYDDFRIADMETGNTLYTIVLRNPYGKAELWGVDNNFNGAIIEGTWKDIKKFFNE